MKKMQEKIPLTQAAYLPGRGTTEQVFAIKIMAEKAISSSNYEINVLLLDMSNAFDTIECDTLINYLKQVLEPDELHILYLLRKDVEIQIRVEKTTGKSFITNMGSPQGDSASVFLFIFYLSISLNQGNPEAEPVPHDHGYCAKEPRKENYQKNDHLYASYHEKKSYTQDQQYADDIGWITTNKSHAKDVSENIPDLLKERNLLINADKTEKYFIKKGGSEEWKSCKYRGSLLDTERDIQRRKGLAYDAYNKIKSLVSHKRASTSNKIRRFNAFVSTIFLYNSELWTLTSKLRNKIGVLQRILLRKCLRITRRDHITSEELYERTATKPWSTDQSKASQISRTYPTPSPRKTR